MKTKSLTALEEKMGNLDVNSIRYRILSCVKNFKTSWIDLGQALYAAWKDKLYKEWGYNNFDIYAAKEIGIKKVTAMKLLRSYYFLEKEEPRYLDKEYLDSEQALKVPSLDSVDVLRLAKNKKILPEEDYARFKDDIFEKGRPAAEVKRDLTALIRQRQELDPEEAWQKRKVATVKRFLTALKSLKQEIESAKLLPYPIIKEAEGLIKKLEAQIL